MVWTDALALLAAAVLVWTEIHFARRFRAQRERFDELHARFREDLIYQGRNCHTEYVELSAAVCRFIDTHPIGSTLWDSPEYRQLKQHLERS